MRRCAISIPANIVEGYGRRTEKDKLQFYYIARGSLNELEYYLDISFRLEYLDEADSKKIELMRKQTGRLLTGLIKSISS
jgi:four helix bundle protein